MWLKEELETVVVIEPPTKKASVYSNHGTQVKKLRELGQKYIEVEIIRDEGDAIEVEMPSNWVAIRRPKQVSEETRRKMSERMKATQGKIRSKKE